MRRPDHSSLVFCGTLDTLLTARCGIFELAADATAVEFESTLLTARIHAVRDAHLANRTLSDFDLLNALDALPNALGGDTRERMRHAGYVLRQPPAMAADALPPVPRAQREAWTLGRPMPVPPPAPPLREADEMPWMAPYTPPRAT
jgi:hypothetical protein